jgi:hypothetical protein
MVMQDCDDRTRRLAHDHRKLGQPRDILRPRLCKRLVAAHPQDTAVTADLGIQVVVVEQGPQVTFPDPPLLSAPPGVARFIRHLVMVHVGPLSMTQT